MALVRILIDGYNLLFAMSRKENFRDYQSCSLLHSWPELAEGRARHSAAARDELITWLARYQDATGTPVTVIFDGSGKARKGSPDEFTRQVEVLFSGGGQTADDLLERAAFRFREFGDVLVVTDDYAVRDVVGGAGGLTSSCENFLRSIQIEMGQLAQDIKSHNRRERNQFKRPATS